MPKYIEPLELYYSEEFLPLLQGDVRGFVHHDAALEAYHDLDITGVQIIGEVRENWRATATTNVTAILMKATIKLTDTHEQDRIVPPLTADEVAMLKGKYATYAVVAESMTRQQKPSAKSPQGKPTNKKPTTTHEQPTDTQKVDTDWPKE